MGISQPALSKQIKSLEKSLGTALIERAGRGIRLTDAGEELAGHAHRMQTLIENAELAMAEICGLRRGRLAVAASPTIATYLIPRLLVRYRLKYPGISLHVEVEQSATMTPRLLDGKIDLAFTEVQPTADRLVARVFMRDLFQAIVPTGHPLARRKNINIAEFINAGLIIRDHSVAGESFVERELYRLSGAEVHPILRVNSTEAVKEAVAAGLGVAIVSGLALHADDSKQRLTKVQVRGVTLRRPLYCVRPNSGQPSKAAKAFLCMLDHAARGSLPPLDQPITPAK